MTALFAVSFVLVWLELALFSTCKVLLWSFLRSLIDILLGTKGFTVQNHHLKAFVMIHAGSKLFGPWLSFKGSIAGGQCLSSARPIAYLLLHNATDNFSSSNLLGKGSFSCVYKAKLDHDVFAAVKRLEENGKQGEIEFQVDFFPWCFSVPVSICNITNETSSCGICGMQAEVGLMSKIRHPNLVSLLGFSSDGPERLLVYELMENGSLHDQLHGM
jgi:hypothetical protein